jgi:hypothetical protein
VVAAVCSYFPIHDRQIAAIKLRDVMAANETGTENLWTLPRPFLYIHLFKKSWQLGFQSVAMNCTSVPY